MNFIKKLLTLHENKLINYLWKNIILTTLSPTYILAKILKNKDDIDDHANIIKFLNILYLVTSFSIAIILGFSSISFLLSYAWSRVTILITTYYCFSRINEIFIAFNKDAVDKMKYKENDTRGLKYFERISLAFRSYMELIINYGVLYYILSNITQSFNKPIRSIMDAIYYSGVTITTLGYGDVFPIHISSKFLSIYEVVNGMLLVIVCFTIYVSQNFSSTLKTPQLKLKKNMSESKIWLTIIITLVLIFLFQYQSLFL